MDLSEEQQAAIREWASTQPHVKAAILFGSRARGEARPDSDVDLAVEFHVRPDQVGEVFFWHGEQWQTHLTNVLGLQVSLAHLAGDQTPIHSAAVEADGIEIYRDENGAPS